MSDGVETIGMPRLGVAMTEGTIVEWRKGPGDEVEAGETLVTIGNDKAEIDVPSPCEGVVEELLANVDQVVPVLQPIARIRVE